MADTQDRAMMCTAKWSQGYMLTLEVQRVNWIKIVQAVMRINISTKWTFPLLCTLSFIEKIHK
uniref:Uncharacterized protein n=1 Tax=Arundo donax TaxID=35708 RepID=A0A0A9GND4_ARUDO